MKPNLDLETAIGIELARWSGHLDAADLTTVRAVLAASAHQLRRRIGPEAAASDLRSLADVLTSPERREPIQ